MGSNEVEEIGIEEEGKKEGEEGEGWWDGMRWSRSEGVWERAKITISIVH